jgi:transcriptional regulator with XRE-family HTH domain
MLCNVVDNRSLDEARAFASLWASRDWPGIELRWQRFDAPAASGSMHVRSPWWNEGPALIKVRRVSHMAGAKKRRPLSDLERQGQMFDLRQQGLTFAEIARRMQVTPQAVHHALQSFARLCCRLCQAELNQAGARTTDRGKTLCPPCLAKRPEAPFADHLRAYRIAAGLTRQELSRLTRVSTERLACYESGFARTTSWADQVRLFQALGVRLVVDGQVAKQSLEVKSTAKKLRRKKSD